MPPKTNEQVLRESTQVAQEVARARGGTFTQGIGFSPNKIDIPDRIPAQALLSDTTTQDVLRRRQEIETELGGTANIADSLKGLSSRIDGFTPVVDPLTSIGAYGSLTSPTRQRRDELISQGSSALQDLRGKGERALELQEDNNVQGFSDDLAAIRSEIAELNVQKRQTLRELEKNPQGLFGNALIDETNRITREFDVQLADKAIIEQAALGNYNSALQLVDRQVELEFAGAQEELDAAKAELELLKPRLDEEQQVEATRLQIALDERGRVLDEAKADRTAIRELAIDALAGGAPVSVVQDALSSGNLDDAVTALGSYVGSGDTQIIDLPTGGKALIDSRTGQIIKTYGGVTATGGADAAIEAIIGLESGGDYSAVSPVLKGGAHKGERSYGKYQILQSNIGPWTEQYYGQRLTPDEFLQNQAAQDAVGQGYIRDLWNQYGNIEDVASVYFTGVPYEQALAENRVDQGTGMTVQQYVANIKGSFDSLASFGGAGDDLPALITGSAGGKDVTDTFLQSMEKSLNTLGQVTSLNDSLKGEYTGPIMGAIRSNNPYDTKAQIIAANLKAIVPNLARGVYGEVGVLTDTDIANYSKTLPNLKSTEDVNKALLAITAKAVLNSIENKLRVQAQGGRDVSGYTGTLELARQQVNAALANSGLTGGSLTPQDEEALFDQTVNGDSAGGAGDAVRNWFSSIWDKLF